MVDEAYYPIDETIYQVSREFQQSIDAEQTRTSGEKRGMLLLGLLADGIAAHASGDYYRLRLLLERVARTGQHERETFNALAERHAQTRVNLGIFAQVAEFFRDKVHEPHPWHADLISYADLALTEFDKLWTTAAIPDPLLEVAETSAVEEQAKAEIALLRSVLRPGKV